MCQPINRHTTYATISFNKRILVNEYKDVFEVYLHLKSIHKQQYLTSTESQKVLHLCKNQRMRSTSKLFFRVAKPRKVNLVKSKELCHFIRVILLHNGIPFYNELMTVVIRNKSRQKAGGVGLVQQNTLQMSQLHLKTRISQFNTEPPQPAVTRRSTQQKVSKNSYEASRMCEKLLIGKAN